MAAALSLGLVAQAQPDPECLGPFFTGPVYDGTAGKVNFCTPTLMADGSSVQENDIAFCRLRIGELTPIEVAENLPARYHEITLPTGLHREQPMDFRCCRYDGAVEVCGETTATSAIRFRRPEPGAPNLVSPTN